MKPKSRPLRAPTLLRLGEELAEKDILRRLNQAIDGMKKINEILTDMNRKASEFLRQHPTKISPKEPTD